MQVVVYGKLVGADCPAPSRMVFPLQMSIYILSELKPSTYVFPCVTTAKACLTSLLATANAAIASKSNNAEINISHLCKGIYILRVETSDGYKNVKFTINK